MMQHVPKARCMESNPRPRALGLPRPSRLLALLILTPSGGDALPSSPGSEAGPLLARASASASPPRRPGRTGLY